jgi:hypothetical protein
MAFVIAYGERQAPSLTVGLLPFLHMIKNLTVTSFSRFKTVS